jgi:hypothetical protein
MKQRTMRRRKVFKRERGLVIEYNLARRHATTT